jgi:putative membrane protein
MLRWLIAAVHLLAMGMGLGGVWARARALRGPLDPAGLRRVFTADSWWGISALLLIPTGLVRAFAGLEKGSAYYLHNQLFWTKMGLLALILFLELWPMAGLIRWRIAVARGQPVDSGLASRYAGISYLQTALLALMVLAATGMARGVGAGG